MEKSIAFHYITGVIFIIISIFVLIYFLGFVHTTATTIDGKEYEVFKDLLTMVLTIVGLIIAGITFILNDFLSKRVGSEAESMGKKIKSKLDEHINVIKTELDEHIKVIKTELDKDIQEGRAKIYVDIGLFYWMLYNMNMNSLPTKSDDPAFKNLTRRQQKDIMVKENTHYKFLIQAIDLTEQALKKCQNVVKPNEGLLYQIKNNLAYYFADKPVRLRGGTGDGTYAKKLADEIEAEIPLFPNFKNDWDNTCKYVRLRFP